MYMTISHEPCEVEERQRVRIHDASGCAGEVLMRIVRLRIIELASREESMRDQPAKAGLDKILVKRDGVCHPHSAHFSFGTVQHCAGLVRSHVETFDVLNRGEHFSKRSRGPVGEL
jgi:hypothetical protein